MNSKIIMGIIGGFLAGLGIGAGGCYLLLRTKTEEYINSEIENGINEYIEWYENGGGIYRGLDGEVSKEEADQAFESAVNPPSERSKASGINRKRDTDKDIDYTAFSDSATRLSEAISDEEIDAMEDDEREAYLEAKEASLAREKAVKEGKAAPYRIKKAEYEALSDEMYEKIELIYHLGDDIISDDMGNRLLNTDVAVGEILEDSGWIDKQADTDGRAGAIFVLNPAVMAAYRVTAAPDCFYSE